MRLLLRFISRESAAQHWRHAQERKKVRRGAYTHDLFRLSPPRQSHHSRIGGGDVFKRFVLLPPIRHIGVSGSPLAEILRGRFRPEKDQAISVWVRQRTQQNSIDH